MCVCVYAEYRHVSSRWPCLLEEAKVLANDDSAADTHAQFITCSERFLFFFFPRLFHIYIYFNDHHAKDTHAKTRRRHAEGFLSLSLEK